MTSPLCFLDTETTGVHPGRLAWEFAAIRREPNGDQTEHHMFIEIELDDADPFGLRVGRFYERHPVGRYLSGLDEKDPTDPTILTGPASRPPLLSPYAAAQRIARITHGAHIVGAVPNFDTETLAALLRNQGLTPAWHYHVICVETLIVGQLAARGESVAPPWSSNDLSTKMGVVVEKCDRHTALGDAQWARDLYDAVMSAGVR
jgi:hypothetical protein